MFKWLIFLPTNNFYRLFCSRLFFLTDKVNVKSLLIVQFFVHHTFYKILNSYCYVTCTFRKDLAKKTKLNFLGIRPWEFIFRAFREPKIQKYSSPLLKIGLTNAISMFSEKTPWLIERFNNCLKAPNISSEILLIKFDEISSHPGLLLLFSKKRNFLVLHCKVLFFQELDLHT